MGLGGAGVAKRGMYRFVLCVYRSGYFVLGVVMFRGRLGLTVSVESGKGKEHALERYPQRAVGA